MEIEENRRQHVFIPHPVFLPPFVPPVNGLPGIQLQRRKIMDRFSPVGGMGLKDNRLATGTIAFQFLVFLEMFKYSL